MITLDILTFVPVAILFLVTAFGLGYLAGQNNTEIKLSHKQKKVTK